MKLYNIIMASPMQQTITVTDYTTNDILVDCETVHNIIGSRRFILELQNLQVYKLEVGKEYGDLIVHVSK
jgi:hypothetical protein